MAQPRHKCPELPHRPLQPRTGTIVFVCSTKLIYSDETKSGANVCSFLVVVVVVVIVVFLSVLLSLPSTVFVNYTQPSGFARRTAKEQFCLNSGL